MAWFHLLSFLLALVAAASASIDPAGIKRIHVIFSNHLDVGFTDLDSAVIELYFHTHYPNAIKLADAMAEEGKKPGFRYTTHSWLLSLFFDCPPNMGFRCPNSTEMEAVGAAIKKGQIVWHAAPFNPEYEVFDGPLLEFAFDLTHKMDDQFGLPHKKTISLRDVPGATRAIIPILTRKGIKAFSGGVNGFSAPPAIANDRPFWWRDPESGEQILVMWHPGGYGGLHKKVYIADKHSCIHHKGFDQLMCVSWRDDNAGPPVNSSQVHEMYHVLHQQFPDAELVASTFDDFVSELEAAAPGLDLQVFTGEIGDTWIHGLGTDPVKSADYRAVVRARSACIQTPTCDSSSYGFWNFSRLLVKVPEHTWGVAFLQYWGDASNYTNTYLQQQLATDTPTDGMVTAVESWRRQRAYIDWALEALDANHPIRAEVEQDRAARHVRGRTEQQESTHCHTQQQPPRPLAAGQRPEPCLGSSPLTAAGWQMGRKLPLTAAALKFATDSWQFELDPKTGGMLHLRRLYGKEACAGNDWAGGQPLAPSTDSNPACRTSSRGASSSSTATSTISSGTRGSRVSNDRCGTRLASSLNSAAAASGMNWLSASCCWACHQVAAAVQQMRTWLQAFAGWWGDKVGCSCCACGCCKGESTRRNVAAAGVKGCSCCGCGCCKGQSSRRNLAAVEGKGCSSCDCGRCKGGNACSMAAVDGKGCSSCDCGYCKGKSACSMAAVDGKGCSCCGCGCCKGKHTLQSAAVSCSCGCCHCSESSSSRVDSEHELESRSHCRSTPHFAELRYNVYNEDDYSIVWEHYANLNPPWIGDFGKYNLSASSNMSEQATAQLEEVFVNESPELGLMLHLRLSFPHYLVRKAGAPAAAWVVLQAPPASAQLHLWTVWQDKTPTRLPESLWFRFKPAEEAVDVDSWTMHKINSRVSPSEIVHNGSHSAHALSANAGMTVSSPDGSEELHVYSKDAPLVALGKPSMMPNPCVGPNMHHGVSWCLTNNIWGTNYPMWVPWSDAEVNMAFRFTLEARLTEARPQQQQRQRKEQEQRQASQGLDCRKPLQARYDAAAPGLVVV